MAKPTKYAHVVRHLPKFLGDDPDRLALLGKLREEILATPVVEEDDWNLSAQLLSRLRALNATVADVLAGAKKCPSRDAAGLTRAWVDARFLCDSLNEWRASAQLLVDAYERMMVDQLEAEGLSSLRLASGPSVSTSQEPYGKVVDKEKFRLWCIANGYKD